MLCGILPVATTPTSGPVSVGTRSGLVPRGVEASRPADQISMRAQAADQTSARAYWRHSPKAVPKFTLRVIEICRKRQRKVMILQNGCRCHMVGVILCGWGKSKTWSKEK